MIAHSVLRRQRVGFSLEIETQVLLADLGSLIVARGLASRLRLKLAVTERGTKFGFGRQRVGFSLEIETNIATLGSGSLAVARGLASRLRLKLHHELLSHHTVAESPEGWLLA